jgi:hypothetical protein
VTQPNSTLVQGLVLEPQAPSAPQPPTPPVVLSLLGMLAVAVLLAVGAWHQARRGRVVSKPVAVKQYTVG